MRLSTPKPEIMLPKIVRLVARLVLFATISAIVPVQAQEGVELLKGKTAVFLVPAKQLQFIEDYRKMLPQAWTLTPIEIIKWDDIDKYPENDKNLFFVIHASERSATSNTSGRTYYNNQYYLTLSPNLEQEKKPGKEEYCRIELHSDHPAEWISTRRDDIDRFYSNYEFPNFSLPYMMGYLRFVQRNLQNNKNPSQVLSYTDKDLLAQLANETLYVPLTAFESSETSTGKKGPARYDDVFKDAYGGKFQHVSTEDLVNLVKNNTANKPIFVFEYVVTGINKYIGVLDITTGTVVYRRQVALSNTLKSHDVAKILK
jgi:hypothetical protein